MKNIPITSVVDSKLFIPDLDPAFNFPSSGSGSGSRQKFRIHADPDPDPTCINKVSIIRTNKNHPLNLIKKKNLNNNLPFSMGVGRFQEK